MGLIKDCLSALIVYITVIHGISHPVLNDAAFFCLANIPDGFRWLARPFLKVWSPSTFNNIEYWSGYFIYLTLQLNQIEPVVNRGEIGCKDKLEGSFSC